MKQVAGESYIDKSCSMYSRGRLAFREDKPITVCTHPIGSAERTLWRAGWWAAYKAQELEDLNELKRPGGLVIHTDSLYETRVAR